MRGIALTICWILLALAIPAIILFGLLRLAMRPYDIATFLGVAALVYTLVFAVGASLNARYETAIRRFVGEETAELHLSPIVQRSYGFLMVTLLPFVVYILALSLYLAIAFVLYGWNYGVAGAGRVPIAFIIGLAIVGICAFIAFFVALRHLLFPRRYSPLGRDLDREEQTELWTLADTIADRVGAPHVHRIVLTPMTGATVFTNAALPVALVGRGQRVLELGFLTIQELTVDELSAVLAHEFGHISNRDTRWGIFTHSMGSALTAAARATPGPMGGAGGQSWIIALVLALNPAYWLLHAFVWLYFRITTAFSRSRELAADVRALSLFGGPSFRDGLLKVATRSAVAGAFFQSTVLRDARMGGSEVTSLSASFKEFQEGVAPEEIAGLEEALLAQEQGRFDSHPSLGTRIGYADRFDGVRGSDERPAGSVLHDVEGLDRELTALQRSALDVALASRRSY